VLAQISNILGIEAAKKTELDFKNTNPVIQFVDNDTNAD
jgi:CTP synthase (UTP-ammonia lyase)